MNLAILSAFEDEITHSKSLFQNLEENIISKHRYYSATWNEHSIIIGLTGIGTTAAAITTTVLCEAYRPDLILVLGVAGGLKPNLHIGDLVLASKIIDIDLHQLPNALKDTPYESTLIDPHLNTLMTYEYSPPAALVESVSTLPIARLQTGTIVTSNTFPAPASLFEDIKTLNGCAIEMESSAVFRTAEYYDIPVITIRAISNLLDENGDDLGTAPDSLERCAKQLRLCLTEILNFMHQN